MRTWLISFLSCQDVFIYMINYYSRPGEKSEIQPAHKHWINLWCFWGLTLFWPVKANVTCFGQSEIIFPKLCIASCEREFSLTLKRKKSQVLAMSIADSFQDKLAGTCSYGLLIYKRKGRQKKKKTFFNYWQQNCIQYAERQTLLKNVSRRFLELEPMLCWSVVALTISASSTL